MGGMQMISFPPLCIQMLKLYMHSPVSYSGTEVRIWLDSLVYFPLFWTADQ